jgi:hypothetical protein
MAQFKKGEDSIQRIRLTSKQLKKEILEGKGVLDTLFSEEYLNDTYLLSNGQVVVDFDTHGYLYNSFNDLREWIKDLKRKQMEFTPSHILKNRLLYGREFLSYRSAMIDTVLSYFKLNSTTPSIEQLKFIDQKLMQEKVEITPILFTGLVTYAGEVIKNSLKDAEWVLLESQLDTAVYEPFIMVAKKKYNPFFPVYKELFEEYADMGRSNLAEVIYIEINK